MRVSLASILLPTLLVVVGCGSASNGEEQTFAVRADTTMTVGPVTKTQFVAQANRACRHGWPTVLENFAQYTSWQSPRMSEKALFAKSVRASFLAGLDFYIFDAIQRLKAPAAEKASVEEVIGKMQIAVERGQRERHAYTPGQLSVQFAAYNRAARRYGLGECLVSGARLLKAEA